MRRPPTVRCVVFKRSPRTLFWRLIEARLEKDGLAQAIDRCIYMDPNTPGLDEGTKLAAKHDVKVAPFFVVNTENGDAQTEDVYTVYMKMKRQVFNQKASVSEANTDVALSIF